MKEISILDDLFSHTNSTTGEIHPSLFRWKRSGGEEYVIITDNFLPFVDKINSSKKYAWLIESPAITPIAYKYIRENYQKFEKIFTFDKDLLTISSKFKLVPIGGCWIQEKDRKIYAKNKNISMILSSKQTTEGHKLRHQIYHSNGVMDFFGFMNPVQSKIEALQNYRFSIVVENHKKDYYFTEKLIDCFATGTVPVYWGCPSIENFFDVKGMVCFDSSQELLNIIPSLTQDKYESMLRHIEENFLRAKKYSIADDIVYEILKDEIK